MTEICEPITKLCPACGAEHTYQCGRKVLYRDPTDKKQACPGGLMVCAECVEPVGDFMEAAYNAQAVRQEWDGS